jgi:succinyl-diaminopimelate desuccinylase
MIDPTLALTEALIRCASLTPHDAGCQDMLNARLVNCGFSITTIERAGVRNTWARRGTTSPMICFAGHTDVVPTGPLEQWTSPPFEPTIRDGHLYGRGAADMKAGLAAFITSIEAFVAANPNHDGSIAVLLTADEEGPSTDGTVAVVDWLREQGIRLDYCVVGEPTSVERLGDMIKNGRRGSLSAKLRVLGVQGHVAYPQLALNPIHAVAPALAELAQTQWDTGDEFFPATTWQISNMNAGTGVSNVIPGHCDILFNFRHAASTSADSLKQRVIGLLDKHGLKYELTWTGSGVPFLTKRGFLTDSLAGVIQSLTGVSCELSCTGGTSDGRFIASICEQVVEIGPINASIHKINECVAVDDLPRLHLIYLGLLHKVLA